jgi:hypothetical protein
MRYWLFFVGILLPGFAAWSQSGDFFTFSAQNAQGAPSRPSAQHFPYQTNITAKPLAVDCRISFNRGPSQPYTIQCFFFSQKSSTKNLFIFAPQSQVVESAGGNFRFEVPELDFYPRSREFSLSGKVKGEEPDAKNFYYQNGYGISERFGWLVRVVSGGVVLKIETNQGVLKDLARRHPEYFDWAFPQ